MTKAASPWDSSLILREKLNEVWGIPASDICIIEYAVNQTPLPLAFSTFDTAALNAVDNQNRFRNWEGQVP